MQAHARGKPEAEGGGRELALPAYGSYSLSQRGEAPSGCSDFYCRLFEGKSGRGD
ncbi:hypothetical protein LINPERHAP1_LOCUS29713 [Linum perenne]